MTHSFSGNSLPTVQSASREEARLCGVPLAHRLGKDGGSREIAGSINAMWLDVEAVLQSVVGRRGVASLLDRTLHLTVLQYPWLAPARPCMEDGAVDLGELTEFLSTQRVEMAVEAGSAMFMIFRDQLATLIGTSLTERLLKSAWSPRSSAPWRRSPTPSLPK